MSIDYGRWSLNHPVRATSLIAVACAIGGGAGVLIAWLLMSIHAVSPNNVIAGFLLGAGGVCVGMLGGFGVIGWIEARR